MQLPVFLGRYLRLPRLSLNIYIYIFFYINVQTDIQLCVVQCIETFMVCNITLRNESVHNRNINCLVHSNVSHLRLYNSSSATGMFSLVFLLLTVTQKRYIRTIDTDRYTIYLIRRTLSCDSMLQFVG